MNSLAPAAQPEVSGLAFEALRLFRSGLDTVQIGKRLSISDAKASRYIWAARSAALSKPADFIRDGKTLRIAI